MTIDTDLELPPTDVPASHAAVPRRPSRRRSALVVLAVLVVGLAGGFGIGQAVSGTDSDADGVNGTATSAAALVEQGLQLQVDGDLAGAAAHYRKAVEADSKNMLAHYNLGLVDQLGGHAQDATREYERTIELEPTYVPALFNLGVLASASGDKEAALDYYRQAVKINPGFAGAQFNLGLLLLETGHEKAGNAAVSKATQLDPSLNDRLEKGSAQ